MGPLGNSPLDKTQAVWFNWRMDKRAFFARFTPDQIRAQYARNANGLRTMLAKAERTGKRVNGYAAADLRASVADYEAMSTASDEAIAARIARPVPPYAERKAMREATLAVGRDEA